MTGKPNLANNTNTIKKAISIQNRRPKSGVKKDGISYELVNENTKYTNDDSKQSNTFDQGCNNDHV